MCKFESDYDLSNSDLSINDQTLNKSDNFKKNLNNRSFYVKSSTNINELNLRKDIKRKLVPDISSKQKVFVKKKLDDIKETIETGLYQIQSYEGSQVLTDNDIFTPFDPAIVLINMKYGKISNF